MNSVTAGGSATINGILYQMLWSLLLALKMHVRQYAASGSSANAVLILEPAGGGGDVQEQTLGRRIVQQLKARSGGGTWSLAEIVTEVLPDLYLAVDPARADTDYQFVTEGRKGVWKADGKDADLSVEAFFHSLRTRPKPETDLSAALDDSRQLKRFTATRKKAGDGSGGSAESNQDEESLWTEDTYTERSLFERMVWALKQRKSVVKDDSDEVIRDKLWHLLANFTVVEAQSPEELERKIDALLLGLVACDTDVREKRMALRDGLAERAARGPRELSAAEFLAEFGLDVTPLTEWKLLRNRAADHLLRTLERLSYQPDEDVREERARELRTTWRTPLLALAGKSGQGKTWLQAALTRLFLEDASLAIWITATGDAERDLDRAAREFQRIWDRDEALALERIASRLKKLKIQLSPWLILAIDGVQSAREARVLAAEDWEAHGIRAIISCSEEVARALQDQSGRITTVFVDEFTPLELMEYLRQHLGEDWPEIRSDVREMLRRPLLAGLYRRISAAEGWTPTREYELYQRYWQRLYDGDQADHPLDAASLRRVALSLLQGEHYPWSGEQIQQAGLDSAAVLRLRRLGWLRAVDEERNEILHDRLLNWAVAEAVVEACRKDKVDPAQLRTWMAACADPATQWFGRSLGYTPMDALWLATDPGRPLEPAVEAILGALDDGSWMNYEGLYAQLLPTLGTRIVPWLYRRLADAALEVYENDWLLVNAIIQGLISIDGDGVSEGALSLLRSDHPKVQRAALRILAERPSAAALPRLWEIHCLVQQDPEEYYGPKEGSFAEPDHTTAALTACVQLDPQWLESAIEIADPVGEPVSDLAFLLLHLNDVELWYRCKPLLQEKGGVAAYVPLAWNMGRYRDQDAVDWLVERIGGPGNRVGPTALRALFNIDPDRALQELHRLSPAQLYFSSGWCLHELLVRAPAPVLAAIRKLLDGHPDPWQLGVAFQGMENSLDPSTLDLLLDAFEDLIDAEVREGERSSQAPLYRPLLVLAAVSRSELLDCFERRQGSTLEDKLSAWLIGKGSRRGIGENLSEREPAIAVLQKIGGAGFSRVINSWLRADSRFARVAGRRLAAKRADDETVRHLVRIAQQDEMWDGKPAEQIKATETLLLLGHGVEVVNAVVKLNEASRYLGARPQPTLLYPEATSAAVTDALRGLAVRPGAVLAAGIFGYAEHAKRIRELVAEAEPDDQMSRFGVIALGLLRDGSPESLRLLQDRIALPKLREVVIRALLEIRSEEAEDILINELRRSYDANIALNLISRERTWPVAVEALRSHVSAAEEWTEAFERLRDLLLHVRNDEGLRALLDDDWLRSGLAEAAFEDEDSFWTVGTKVAAIRGLAYAEPELAFAAARAALRNPAAHDRTHYPYLLAELDTDGAVPLLLEQAVGESSTSVVWAIARALAGLDLEKQLIEQMDSPLAARRQAACQLAGFRPPTSVLLSSIEKCLYDPDEDVARAAKDALERLRAAEGVEQLAVVFEQKPSLSRRWTLLDSMIALGDPGDAHRPAPAWARRIGALLPYLGWRYLLDHLEKRRKELEKVAKREDERR